MVWMTMHGAVCHGFISIQLHVQNIQRLQSSYSHRKGLNNVGRHLGNKLGQFLGQCLNTHILEVPRCSACLHQSEWEGIHGSTKVKRSPYIKCTNLASGSQFIWAHFHTPACVLGLSEWQVVGDRLPSTRGTFQRRRWLKNTAASISNHSNPFCCGLSMLPLSITTLSPSSASSDLHSQIFSPLSLGSAYSSASKTF